MVNPYAAPTAESSVESSSAASFQIPGVAGRLQYEPPGMWRGGRLLVDGQPAKRAFLGKLELPGEGGTTVSARLAEGFTGPVLRIGKTAHPIGPRYPAILGVLTFLPIGLIAIIGGGAMMINRGLARSDRSVGMRVAMMSGVLLLAVTLALGILVALQAAVGK